MDRTLLRLLESARRESFSRWYGQTRLVLADWLEEAGDARHRLVRDLPCAAYYFPRGPEVPSRPEWLVRVAGGRVRVGIASGPSDLFPLSCRLYECRRYDRRGECRYEIVSHGRSPLSDIFVLAPATQGRFGAEVIRPWDGGADYFTRPYVVMQTASLLYSLFPEYYPTLSGSSYYSFADHFHLLLARPLLQPHP